MHWFTNVFTQREIIIKDVLINVLKKDCMIQKIIVYNPGSLLKHINVDFFKNIINKFNGLLIWKFIIQRK